jgi:hypothetical protein
MENKIAEMALSYIGEKEVPGNMGFTDKAFEKKMYDVGFQKTYAWCSLFMELCVKEGEPEFYEAYEKLFSASATTTYKNFDIAGKASQSPEIGCGVIWRHGNGWTGHAGIVVGVDLNNATIETIEGNSNNDGSRDGYAVVKKTRHLFAPYDPTGLNMVGFIHFT